MSQLTEFFEDLADRFEDTGQRIKVAKIARVFAREGGLLGGRLSSPYSDVCGHAGRCAIGALLHAEGVSDDDLRNFGVPTSGFEILEAAYGITETEVSNIIGTNDGFTGYDAATECGLGVRPNMNVRVCVVNNRVRQLAGR